MGATALADDETIQNHHDTASEADHQNVVGPAFPATSNPSGTTEDEPTYSPADTHALQNLHAALSVMQNQYFSLWLGQWTTAIDWTAAVIGTHVAATLGTLSRSLSYTMPGTFDKSRKLDVEAQMVESEINKYFGHLITYYFGQDYFSIRNEAFDDMLWVVLGWLEAIQLIRTHSERHYPDNGDGRGDWHAQQFIPAFAHRARVFYELAEEGWDWKLCGGGMTWNPRLLPYKNAITNQLFISASVSMYLYFPGDDNCSPFMGVTQREHPDWNSFYAKQQDSAFTCSESENEPIYDPIYLANAVNGYNWLANSGMLNDQGLYTDGFHISGYAENKSRTECDERNEIVYTYNQGVILSGLRGLWEATGNLSYLNDGHALINNVIRATGWSDTTLSTAPFAPPPPSPSPTTQKASQTSDPWAGLGAHGILTELCDPDASCSQDSQTFKGIFFHHLTSFCTPLPTWPVRQGKTHHAVHEIHVLHQKSCAKYAPWVAHNANAALKTRNEEGKFGMWWGAESGDEGLLGEVVLPRGALDYMNDPGLLGTLNFTAAPGRLRERGEERMVRLGKRDESDLNDRGRGRTVETQGGGVAVLHAVWEFLRRAGKYDDDVAVLEL
ncbi:hypothetical protein N0V90_004779 [Kalmusia sp. IMI 367209]|nr:hypothetical protein N0V90_004779 [Kalmusia sp. IMI 367209]